MSKQSSKIGTPTTTEQAQVALPQPILYYYRAMIGRLFFAQSGDRDASSLCFVPVLLILSVDKLRATESLASRSKQIQTEH